MRREAIAPGCEPSELLELVETAFDAISHSIEDRIARDQGPTHESRDGMTASAPTTTPAIAAAIRDDDVHA